MGEEVRLVPQMVLQLGMDWQLDRKKAWSDLFGKGHKMRWASSMAFPSSDRSDHLPSTYTVQIAAGPGSVMVEEVEVCLDCWEIGCKKSELI